MSVSAHLPLSYISHFNKCDIMEKTKHSVVKHLIAVAVALLLFGSSGGVAWGQTRVQMDCKNAFGAGESRWSTRGTSPITSDIDSILGDDPNTPPIHSIIIGTVNRNVVGEKWVNTDITNNADGSHKNGLSGIGASYCYSGYHDSHSNWHCTDRRHCPANSDYVNPTYTGCDNTFFRNYNGTFSLGNADFTNALKTVVNVVGGNLGGNLSVGAISTSALDFDYFYFKNIPWGYPVHTFTRVSVPRCIAQPGNTSVNVQDATHNTYDHMGRGRCVHRSNFA